MWSRCLRLWKALPLRCIPNFHDSTACEMQYGCLCVCMHSATVASGHCHHKSLATTHRGSELHVGKAWRKGFIIFCWIMLNHHDESWCNDMFWSTLLLSTWSAYSYPTARPSQTMLDHHALQCQGGSWCWRTCRKTWLLLETGRWWSRLGENSDASWLLIDCFICSLAFAANGDSHSTMFYILLHDMCTPSLCSLASHRELRITSSTAQGGGGSFKNRKPIGEVGNCESRMAERIHWWTERWLKLFLGVVAMVAVVTSPTTAGCSVVYWVQL